jgi:hypothetical protein
MWWRVSRDWPGETVFLVASGPSLKLLELSRLEGRRVIVVNSSWLHWPTADFLVFADGRWWRTKRLRPENGQFSGDIVTTAAEIGDRHVKKLRKIAPYDGLSADPQTLALKSTSVTGAINLAAHLTGPGGRIVLCGVDARRGPDGERHSHGLPWPWPAGGLPKAFSEQIAELRSIAPSAKTMGVEVVNASPGSAVDAFPMVNFEDETTQ